MVDKDVIRANGGHVLLLGACPPPDRPLPSRPSRTYRRETDRVSVSTCSSSSTYMPPPSLRSSASLFTRDSAQMEPLPPSRKPPAASAPTTRPNSNRLARPDSTILPLSTPLQRPTQLERHNFHALVRRGDKVQYWIAVVMVLAGFPGSDKVPRGHWKRLKRLAEEVWVQNAVDGGREQFVTAWCFVDEPLGDDG